MHPKFLHKECFICGQENPNGLKLKFELSAKGGVICEFVFPSYTCGFPNRIHGGIISAVLDSAMANLLLLNSIVAYTARLEVRFLQPVIPEILCKLQAQILSKKLHLYDLESSLFQNNKKVASAKARFCEPV